MSFARAKPVRRVFGRVKGVEHEGKPLTFELRRDGLWFHRKHSPKWRTVRFPELVAEADRQDAQAKALADARREDPRQLVMFRAVEAA